MTNFTYFTPNFPSQVAIAIDPEYLTKVQSEAIRNKLKYLTKCQGKHKEVFMGIEEK